MSPALPAVPVVRQPGRTDTAPPVWAVMSCPFCSRRHYHDADPVLKAMMLPARCNPTRFYRLVEA